MIEDGRLTRPIKDTNIIGNGPEALAAITGVADNLIVDDSTWTCGKGQYCPVSCGHAVRPCRQTQCRRYQ